MGVRIFGWQFEGVEIVVRQLELWVRIIWVAVLVVGEDIWVAVLVGIENLWVAVLVGGEDVLGGSCNRGRGYLKWQS